MLRLDDDVAISEAVYAGVVLRHYAFAGHWFKVNVTTGLSGRLTETGDPGRRFAVNCDIATPMERGGDSRFGVGLFTDVLVRQDATSYVIADRDRFEEMLGRGVISPAEGRGAGRGLRELLDLIEEGRLLRWLAELAPFGPCQPPPAPPMRRGPVPARVRGDRGLVAEHRRAARSADRDDLPGAARLKQAGLIRGSWSVVGGRRRREYWLTAAGRWALSGKRADWREFAATVGAALEGRPCPNPA